MGGGGVGGVHCWVRVVVVGGRGEGAVGGQGLVGVEVLVVLQAQLPQAAHAEGGVAEGGGAEHVHPVGGGEQGGGGGVAAPRS